VLNFLLGGVFVAWYLHWRGIVLPTVGFWQTLHGVYMLSLIEPEWRTLLAAAFVVHLWLPLFAVAAGVASALGWMRWFVKDALERPYELIGYLIAGMVLIGGIVVKVLGMA
jgi:hypothetical protein